MPKVKGAILKFIPTESVAGMIQQRMGYTEPPTAFYEMTTGVYASTVSIANGTLLQVNFVIDPLVGENSIAFSIPSNFLPGASSLDDSSLLTRVDCSNAVVFSFTKVYLEFHEVDTDELLDEIGDIKSTSQFYKKASIPGYVLGNDTLLESYDITSIYRSFFADFMYAYTHREAPNPGGGMPQAN